MPALLKRFVSASRGRLFSPTPRASDQEHSSPPSPLPSSSRRSRRPRLGDFRSSTTVYNIPNFSSKFFWFTTGKLKEAEPFALHVLRVRCLQDLSYFSEFIKAEGFLQFACRQSTAHAPHLYRCPHVPRHLRDNGLRGECAPGNWRSL